MKRFQLWSVAVLIFCFGSTVWAETTPEDQIAYRKAVMGALGAHVGAISMMVRRKVDYQHMSDQADALASSMAVIGDVFPAESASGDTGALAAIWEQEADFTAKVEAARDASLKLVAAAEEGDSATVTQAFRAVGGACKGCHDNYKQAD